LDQLRVDVQQRRLFGDIGNPGGSGRKAQQRKGQNETERSSSWLAHFLIPLTKFGLRIFIHKMKLGGQYVNGLAVSLALGRACRSSHLIGKHTALDGERIAIPALAKLPRRPAVTSGPCGIYI
jgi:hypothetical protein